MLSIMYTWKEFNKFVVKNLYGKILLKKVAINFLKTQKNFSQQFLRHCGNSENSPEKFPENSGCSSPGVQCYKAKIYIFNSIKVMKSK